MKRFTVSCACFIASCTTNSLQTPTEQGVPFCYTTQTMISKGEDINSQTITECSDKPRVEHFVKDVGLAEDCTTYLYNYSIRGTSKNVKAFLCKFPDGSWQAVDGRYAY